MMWIFIACLLWCSVYWQQNIKEMPLTGSSVCNSSFTHKPAVRTGISLASSISFIADSGMQKKCQKLPMVDQSIDYDLDMGVKCLTAETKPLSCSLVRLNSQPQWLTFGQSHFFTKVCHGASEGWPIVQGKWPAMLHTIALASWDLSVPLGPFLEQLWCNLMLKIVHLLKWKRLLTCLFNCVCTKKLVNFKSFPSHNEHS